MEPHLPLDTYSSVKELVAVGVPEEQAEVQVRIFSTLVVQNLATKRDLRDMRKELEHVMDSRFQELDTKIDGVRTDLEHSIEGVRQELHVTRTELEAKIDGLRNELLIKLGGLMVAGITILGALEVIL